MNNIKKLSLLLVVICGVLMAEAVPSPNEMTPSAETLFQHGMREYTAKNFPTALAHFRTAAKQGHVLAQYQLGHLLNSRDTPAGSDPAQAV